MQENGYIQGSPQPNEAPFQPIDQSAQGSNAAWQTNPMPSNTISSEQEWEYSPIASPFETQPKKKRGLFKKMIALVLSGLLFGSTASAAFYGVSTLFPEKEKTSKPTIAPSSVITQEYGASNTVSQIAQNAMPSVVSITTLSVQQVEYFFFGRREIEYESCGSGIIIGQNENDLILVTNYHVVEESKTITCTFIDDESVEARVEDYEEDMDIAILSIPLSDVEDETLSQIKVAVLGDSDSLVIGEPVIAVGNALGFGQSVTSGIISAIGREIDILDIPMLQTDAAINPGNSGGALLNYKGEVVGINTAKASRENVEGIGWVIPISEVKERLELMMRQIDKRPKDESEMGSLGIQCMDVNDLAQELYGIPAGVCIMSVEEDGPAAKAGLQKGDIITEVGSVPVQSNEDLYDVLLRHKAGESVLVTYRRLEDGEYVSRTIFVVLGASTPTADI